MQYQQYPWFVILPPLLVLIVAAITRKVIFSLASGVFVSCLIINNFSPIPTLNFMAYQIWHQLTNHSNVFTFIYIILLGMIITLMNDAGGTAAYGAALKKILKTQRSTAFSSLALSFLFMIDDFFSSLTVGCIMKPLTDAMHIPRVKLGFLIDALASPLVILMPISTWIGMILAELNKTGISLRLEDAPLIAADPFITYLHVIPFIFYSFAILLSAWFIVHFSFSFGPMKRHEDIARTTGNLFGGKPPLKELLSTSCSIEGSIADFMLPITSLIFCIILSILYFGNSSLIGGSHSLLQTMQHANIPFAMAVGCFTSFVMNIFFMLTQKKLRLHQTIKVMQGGFYLMYESVIILLLAWTFSSVLRNYLQTGTYIAHLLVGVIPTMLLPALFFIVTFITGFSTGSSWGAIAIMIPIAVPMVVSFYSTATPTDPSAIPLLYPVIGAIFAGSVASDNLSPISPTTVMSATSAGSYLHDLVYAQFPYALPALIGSVIAYVAYGIGITYCPQFAAIMAFMAIIIIPCLLIMLFSKFYKTSSI